MQPLRSTSLYLHPGHAPPSDATLLRPTSNVHDAVSARGNGGTLRRTNIRKVAPLDAIRSKIDIKTPECNTKNDLSVDTKPDNSVVSAVSYSNDRSVVPSRITMLDDIKHFHLKMVSEEKNAVNREFDCNDARLLPNNSSPAWVKERKTDQLCLMPRHQNVSLSLSNKPPLPSGTLTSLSHNRGQEWEISSPVIPTEESSKNIPHTPFEEKMLPTFPKGNNMGFETELVDSPDSVFSRPPSRSLMSDIRRFTPRSTLKEIKNCSFSSSSVTPARSVKAKCTARLSNITRNEVSKVNLVAPSVCNSLSNVTTPVSSVTLSTAERNNPRSESINIVTPNIDIDLVKCNSNKRSLLIVNSQYQTPATVEIVTPNLLRTAGLNTLSSPSISVKRSGSYEAAFNSGGGGGCEKRWANSSSSNRRKRRTLLGRQLLSTFSSKGEELHKCTTSTAAEKSSEQQLMSLDNERENLGKPKGNVMTVMQGYSRVMRYIDLDTDW